MVRALLFLLVGPMLGAGPGTAVSGAAELAQTAATAGQTNAAIEEEYQKIEKQDDAAQADVEKWTRENAEAKARGEGVADEVLEKRITARVAPVGHAYEDFLRRHPDHARAHLTYGCFLNDRQDEKGAQVQWEKALQLDPSNPDIYNNLAGRYSESGPAKKAFEYYEKAIELSPNQPLYYHNFAGTMYVLRKNAMAHYGLDEQQVLARIIQLYSNAVRLDPKNFTYATDWAQTYYSLRPFPAEGAAAAWSNTLQRAQSQDQRQEVYVHQARVEMLAGHLGTARRLLVGVTNSQQAVLKSNLLHNIEQRERESNSGVSKER